MGLHFEGWKFGIVHLLKAHGTALDEWFLMDKPWHQQPSVVVPGRFQFLLSTDGNKYEVRDVTVQYGSAGLGNVFEPDFIIVGFIWPGRVG